MPRGRKAVEGIPSYQHRMMFVKQPALWDEAIRRAKVEGISLSAYIEKLIRAEIEK